MISYLDLQGAIALQLSKLPPATKARMKKRDASTQQRRLQIVEAAASCFAEKGFHQASMRDIAGTAGVSLGNLYNHFPGKEALIAEFAVMEEQSINTLEQAVDDEPDVSQALACLVTRYLQIVGAPGEAALTLELSAEAMRNPQFAGAFTGNREKLVGLVCKILARGREKGVFANSIPVNDEANMILDLVEGRAIRAAFSGEQLGRDADLSLATVIGKIVSTKGEPLA